MKKILGCLFSLLLAFPAYPSTIVIPNTFVNGTTIDASQVNSDFTTIANDYNGSVNSSNLATNGVAYSNLSTAIQQLWSYRRPVIQYVSATTVTIETGNNGTSGQVLIIFPDGSFRTDSTSSHIILDTTRNYGLSGTIQSGLRTGSVAVNTWYAVYAVKATGNSTDFVAVADTLLPIQANVSNINSNFGTQGWVYLGLIRNGNGLSANTGVVNFRQVGHMTIFKNTFNPDNVVEPSSGIQYATTASATTLAYSATSGTGATDIPNNTPLGLWSGLYGATVNANLTIQDGGGNFTYIRQNNGNGTLTSIGTQIVSVADGCKLAATNATPMTMILRGFLDTALGVGSNPFL